MRARKLALVGLCIAGVSLTRDAEAQDSLAPRRLELGRFRARGILQCAPSSERGAPIAIVIPGSGAHGPEEAMPGAITRDGKETQLLTSFAEGLRDAGFHTLQVGKPGIDFHTTWDLEKIAYDKALYLGLTWNDLIENANDAIAYVGAEHPCGASTVVLVGHSEGTQRISDVAARNPQVRGVVYLGFHGHSLHDMVAWQAYERPIALFVKSDVDADHDGVITREEGARWPTDFHYVWKEGETRVAIADYAAWVRGDTAIARAVEALSASPLYSKGVWNRAPIYDQVAALPIPILAFTGTLDVMTPPSEVEALADACHRAARKGCEIHLVPGLGHGMSGPKPPRGHPLLDQTEGPVDPDFLRFFTQTLRTWKSGIRPAH